MHRVTCHRMIEQRLDLTCGHGPLSSCFAGLLCLRDKLCSRDKLYSRNKLCLEAKEVRHVA